MGSGKEGMQMKGKARKYSAIREGNRTVTYILYALAALVALIAIYPMYYVLILSLSDSQYAATMRVYLVPKGINFGAYQTLVKDSNIWRAYANTVLYAVANTALMEITCILAAYGLSYKKLIGRKFFTMFLLIPMYFSGGMIPAFLLVTKLGLYDNLLSQILPSCFSIWNIILVRSYFRTVPESLTEAAKIDGAGVFQVLRYVFIPLGKPIFAVIAVYTIVGNWNSWFNAMLYLPHTDWQPLQMYLRRILIENVSTVAASLSPDLAKELLQRKMSNAQLKYAMVIFTSLPVLCTYPFFQKYFVKGMVLGSLKE